MAAVRDPSPASIAPIAARTRSLSAVAEPATVQPSQSTRQRTAWCTTSAGRSSIRTPDAKRGQCAAYRVLIGHRPTPVCNTERNSVIQTTWHQTRELRRSDLRRDADAARLRCRVRRADESPPRCCTRAPGACSITSALPSRAQRNPPPASPGSSASCSAVSRRPGRSAPPTGCASPTRHLSTESLAMHWISTTPTCRRFFIRRRRCTPRERRWRNGGAADGIDLLAAHALGLRARRPRQQRALPRALRRRLAHDRHHRRTRVGDGRDQAARPRPESPRPTA